MERERKIKIATSLCVCLFCALLLVVIGQIVSIATLKKKEAALRAELDALSGDRNTVEELIAYRESDLYIEQVAREIYGMTKAESEEEDA